MAKNSKKKPTSQAQKADLKKLREKGLYRPKNARAAPTKYGKSLLRQFADVITGKASVVTAKSAKGGKGFKEARKYQRGETAVGTVRVRRNKIIVPTQAGEVARFSKKGVRVTRNVGGALYVREPFQSDTGTLARIKAQLKSGDRIALPLNRGKKGIEWLQYTEDEYSAFYNQYDGKGGYKNLSDHIQIFRLEKAKKRPARHI